MHAQRRVLIVTLLAILASLGAPAYADRSTEFPSPANSSPAPPPPGWPEDAQSTTGPIPPPQAARAEQSPAATSPQVVLYDVPAYTWWRGCGPTAAGMVIGYWDGKGFDALVSGSAATQTSAVNNMISSPGNYSDYCLPIDSFNLLPDKSEGPLGDEHADDSIADFMKTSQSYWSNYYGWSWFSHMDDALRGYVQKVAPHYATSAVNQVWGTFTWEVFKAEIDAGRPVVLLVDTDANGGTDHFAPAIGYSDNGETRLYATLNTWDTGIHWYSFAQMAPGQTWGIYGATLFQIQPSVPTPFSKISPSRGTGGYGSTAHLSWGSSSGITSYEYCADTVNNGVCDESWISTSSTSAHLAGLPNGATYYWQVRARNAVGATNANDGVWWHWTVSPPLLIHLPMIIGDAWSNGP